MAAGLVLAAVTLLGSVEFGMLMEPWAPVAAAFSGIVAGLVGCLGLYRRPAMPQDLKAAAKPPARDDTMDNMAALLRSMAEEMVRLKRDGADASRSMADARQASTRIVEAAASAIARLDESAESSAIAARALSMLPGIADTHAQRIELLAARAEQALALVPDSMAAASAGGRSSTDIMEAVQAALAQHIPTMPTGIDAALARLEALPGDMGAAMSASLMQQHPAEAALLDAAIARLEAARPDPMLAVGLMEATERLDSIAHQLATVAPRGADAPESPAPDLAALAGELHAALAPSLAEVLSRRLTAIADAASRDRSGQDEMATVLATMGSRLDDATARLSDEVASRLSATNAEWELRGARQDAGRDALAAVTVRLEAAVGLAEALPDTLRSGLDVRMEAAAAGMQARWATLVDALPAAIAPEFERRMAESAEVIAARFPTAAEGLHAHLAALETLGSVLDGVTDRLIETADALSATGGSLQPMADSARRSMDALALAARELAQARPARAEEPRAGLPAPEVLLNLQETIRGLQSISSAFTAADPTALRA